MKDILNLLFFCSLSLLIAVGSAFAKSPTSQNNSSGNPEVPIEVSADHIDQNTSKHTIRAHGRVVVRYKRKMIRADKVKINIQTGKGIAIGHVFIFDEGIRLKADRSIFNMKNKRGKIYNVQGKFSKNYLIKAKEVRKLSDKRYQLKESTLTTCKGELPDWLFLVDEMDVVLGDRALFKGATFKIRDVPIIHLPIGYVPLDNSRKSGMLMPDIGSSNLDGLFINNSYYWAINEQSDATFLVDYLENRGVRGGFEYRYTPSQTTAGELRSTVLDDDLTGSLFWKFDMVHKQVLPYNFKLDAKLDLVGDDNFSKTFNSNTNNRTRRSTDSFALITKSWDNSTLDILTRLRNSTQDGRDDTFGILPKVTHKVQRTQIGNIPAYYNQEASYGNFRTDLNSSVSVNQEENIQRFDWHPQLSLPFRASSWFSVNPTFGIRGTYYDKGFDSSNQEFDGFLRKSFDVNTTLEGPRFNKVFNTSSKLFPKLNHIIEPRIVYEYIPDIDSDKRDLIKRFDNVDTLEPLNRITYSVNQRLLRKLMGKKDSAQTDQLIRFEILQAYDIREATKDVAPGEERRPFSEVRFDIDSRTLHPLLLNLDGTFNVYDDELKTTNILLGLKPTDWATLMFERRWTRDSTTFIQGTLDLKLKKGWHFQYSTRYDELASLFQENDVSLNYDNPCRCWGFGFDFIKRNNINGRFNQDDTRFMFRFNLRGLGSFGTKSEEKLLHRNF